MNTEQGEQARTALGIDGTAGDAQDVPHPFQQHETAPCCLACGLSESYHRRHGWS